MTQAPGAVRLGLMPPMTGVVGMYGVEIAHAGRIACELVNERGGVLGRPLELAIEDDGSLPESAVRAATRLVEVHGCAAIIGNLLSNSRIAVTYEVAERRRIPYLNFSFYEGSIVSRYFFHFAALPNQQIDRMIPYMRTRYGPKMFFAGNNYEWPRGSIDAAKRALQESGGQVVGEEYCPIGAAEGDIERVLDAVAASGAEVFVPYFAGADQIHMLTRFAQRGLKDRMAVVMGHYDEIMASALRPNVREGLYSSNTYFMTVDTAENKAYLERLSRQPGVRGLWPGGNGIMTNFGEGTYLCVMAFAQAANQAGSLEPDGLIAALETVAVSGPQGAVRMDPDTHHAQVNTRLARCGADGTFEIVEQFGAIPPVLPARYRHLRMSKVPDQEDMYLQSRILAQMTDGVLLVRAADGAIVYANPGAERMYGYGEGALAGRHYSVLLAPSGTAPEEVAAAISELLSRKGVWEGEAETVASDGRRSWSALSSSTFSHPRYGEVWLVSTKDITERKHMEGEIRAASLYTRSLIEASPDPLVTISAEGTITDVNEATVAATGIPREQLVGTDFSHYFTEPDRARAGYRRVFAQGSVTDYPLALRHRDGHVTDVLYNASLYRNEAGTVLGVFAAARDVTERKRAEDALRHLSEALEQKVAERTADLQSFAYSVSHDLRVPLRAIDGFSAILQEDYGSKLDAEASRLIGIIRASTLKMGRLIDDILVFSRTGQRELSVDTHDMTELAHAAAEELAPACAGRTVAFTWSPLPLARGDLTMLRQVWVNLLSNAVKFSRRRERAVVEIGCQRRGGENVFFVRDNGVGFDMRYAPKLFGVFQRLHGVDEFEGTGIGLAIVKRIVTRHGGRVWAEGRVDQGATFYFTLPVVEASEAAAPSVPVGEQSDD